MPREYRDSIDRLRERCRDSAAIAAADGEALLAYSHELDALGPAELGDATHEKYLMRLVKMAEECDDGDLAEALDEEAAAKRVNSWINSHYQNPESNKTARDALRSFGKHATSGQDQPDSIAWVPTGYPSDFDRSPDPADMYRWEEHVVPTLEACRNYRDEAMIALAFDIGPRSGELKSLTVGDLTSHEWGVQVSVDGKTGGRSPVLMIAPDRVQRWLGVHPAPDDPEAPLWSKLDRADGISDQMVLKIFREAVDRADITPPSKPTPTRFRKSSASHLARRGVSQVALENRYGWTRGSDEAARYIAVFSEESRREVAQALGVDVGEEEPDPVGPITCTRCEQETPRDKERCVWCGQAFSVAAAEEAQQTHSAGYDAVAELLDETDTELDAATLAEAAELLTDPRLQALVDGGHE